MKPLNLLSLVFAMIAAQSIAQESYKTDTTKTHQLTGVVITAQHSPQSAKSSVYQIKTITNDQLRSQGATNLRELLFHEMNMDLQQKSVFGTSLDILGISKENVNILIDGVPVIGRLNGVIDLTQIQLSNIEKVEIIEGPTSVFYGSDAIAGTVNLITKKASTNGVEGTINTYLESIGQYNVDGSMGYFKGDHSVKVSGGANYFKGYSETDTLRNQSWESRDQYFTDGSYAHYFNNLKARIGGRYFQEELLKLGEPDTTSMAEDISYKTRRWSAEAGLNGDFGKRNYIDITLSYLDYNRRNNTYNTNVNSELQELTDKASDHDTTKFNSWFFKGQYNKRTNNSKLSVAVGSEINIESTAGSRIKDKEQDIQDYAVFGSLKYVPIDWFAIQPGLRWSYNSRYTGPVSPAVNLKFDLGSSAYIRASYAKGFRAPSLKELFLDFYMHAGPFTYHITGNEDLKAERSHSVNVSYDHAINLGEKQVLELEASGFYNKMSNLIALSELVDYNRHYINVNNYETHGGKLSLNYKPIKQISISAGGSVTGRFNSHSENYSVDKFTYTTDLVGQAKYCMIKHKLSFAFYYKYFGDRPGFVVDRRTREIEQTTVDAVHLLDFNVSKSFANNLLKISGGAKNLMNVKSVSTVGKQTGEAHSTSLFLWGRSFYLGLQLNLNKNIGKGHKKDA